MVLRLAVALSAPEVLVAPSGRIEMADLDVVPGARPSERAATSNPTPSPAPVSPLCLRW
jgi:hypothetical protein